MRKQEKVERQDQPTSTEPGWYEYHGGLRFYENGWTDHFAPPPTINYWLITLAVIFGMIVGWLLLWAGAQASPEHIYWPVKFVVKEFQR